MTTTSKPSSLISSIGIPRITNLSTKFTYNFYVDDESINQESGIPNSLKSADPNQINTEITNTALRLPRFVSITWGPPAIPNKQSNQNIQENLDKIYDESISGKYFPYFFSTREDVEFANLDVNQEPKNGVSQATTIDAYVNNLLKNYAETGDQASLPQLKQKIVEVIQQVESISDKPGEAFGVKFYSNEGSSIETYSGFDQLVASSDGIKSRINSLVLADLFNSSSLSESNLANINALQQSAKNAFGSNSNPNSFYDSDSLVNAVSVGAEVNPASSAKDIPAQIYFIGYIVERFEILPTGPVLDRTIVIENPEVSSITDTLVKYGSTYQYFVRTVIKLVAPQFDISDSLIKLVTFYISSSPQTTTQLCDEKVPPPPPVDLNFVWDYKRRKLSVCWSMPPNTQRDIKQFQVFRRKTIYEPFELLKQQCFDYSGRKYTTGEVIDGNKIDMTDENRSYVEIQTSPMLFYIDEDFHVNADDQIASKYIYTIASVDAHGFISNYSSQFEVSFDFFKNKITKKLISTQGAPRPYPNLLISRDLFRDTIKTSGLSSTKMKVYFMPEYFKVRQRNGNIQRLVGTVGKNSYYKMQIINLQNQKSETLKITIDDPYDLVGA